RTVAAVGAVAPRMSPVERTQRSSSASAAAPEAVKQSARTALTTAGGRLLAGARSRLRPARGTGSRGPPPPDRAAGRSGRRGRSRRRPRRQPAPPRRARRTACAGSRGVPSAARRRARPERRSLRYVDREGGEAGAARGGERGPTAPGGRARLTPGRWRAPPREIEVPITVRDLGGVASGDGRRAKIRRGAVPMGR